MRIILLLLALSAPAAPSAADRYRVIVERQIFRHSFARPAPPVKPPPATPPPRVISLTGVIRTPDELVAVFEEKAVGDVHFLRVGDEIKDAKIVQINEHSVVVDTGGEEKLIEIGETLSGAPAPSPSPTSPATQPAAPAAPAAQPSAPEPTPLSARKLPKSLRERIEAMKRRRLQQLRK